MEADACPPPHQITLNGAAMAVTRGGDPTAPPLLLLHGGGMDSARLSWRCLLPVLARTHRVIAPDWPGYGGSDAMPGPHRIADLGRWLVSLLDRLEIGAADVVGISMGAGVGFWLALEHPGRVRRLVAAAPYGLQRRAPMHALSWAATRLPLTVVSFRLLRRHPGLLRRALAGIFKHPDRITEDLLAEVRAALAVPQAGRAFWRFQHDEIGPRALSSVYTDRLDELRCPVLLVQGDADRLVPLAAVRAAHERLPDARLEILDAGHWPMRELPEPFNAHVAAFLAGHPD